MSELEAFETTVSRRNHSFWLWFLGVSERVMETREIEAKRRAAVYLRGLDEETIKNLGINKHVVADLRRVRAGAGAARSAQNSSIS